MAVPRFFSELIEGRNCPVCQEPFALSPYTQDATRCPPPISFVEGCYAHPIHKKCHVDFLAHHELAYKAARKELIRTVARPNRMTPLQTENLVQEHLGNHRHLQSACVTCNKPIDEAMHIHLTAMYPPPAGLVPPQLPLSPTDMRIDQYADLPNYRSGCCEYPHFPGEWFVVTHPCRHTLHTRCYLNSFLGDLAWMNLPHTNPTNEVRCPTCQVLIEYVRPWCAQVYPL